MPVHNNVIELVIRLKDQATTALAGFRAQLSGLKGAVTAAVGGIGAGLAIRALVRNIVEAEQASLKLDVAYRNMGGGLGRTRKQLDDLAQSLQRTTTASDDQVKEAEALLLTFDQVRGDAFERTIRVANDLSAALGEDLVSATQKIGRALQDPAGSLGLLARSGIKLSDDLEKTIKKLAETGRMAEAQEILLAELERRFGNVATAARDTLGGALTALKNQMGELFEGDSSSFGDATKQINALTTRLQDPEIKAGFDTLISGLATATAKAIEYSAAIAEGARITGEFFAKIKTGHARGTEPLDLEFEALDRLKTARADITEGRRPFLSTSKSRDELAKLDAAIAASHKRIQTLQVENSRGSVYNPAKTAASTPAAKPRPASDVQGEEAAKAAAEAAAKLAALRAQVLDGVAAIIEAWAQSEERIEKALASGAITAAEARTSLDALRQQVRESVLPAQFIEGDALAQKIELVNAALRAGKVNAAEAAIAIAQYRREAAAEVGPSWLKAAAAWEALEARITAAAKAGVLTVEQARAALDELTKENLAPVEITVAKVTIPEAPVSEFVRAMQEHIQTGFADAFMAIGEGDGKTVARKFLDGFKRIFAEAAAVDLAKLLKLHTLGRGGGSILGGLFGGGGPSAGSAEEARKYDEKTGPGPGSVVGAVARAAGAPGSECAAQCASGVVEKVATTVSAPLKEFSAGVAQSLKLLTGGLWKFITGTLTKLWEFIKGALAAIRGMASSGGGSGGWMGAIVSGIGSIFGASAGGGRIQARKPRLVGEEGPEVIVPAGDSEVMNERQLRFAGAGLLAALGALTAGIEAAAVDLSALRTREPARITKPEARVPAVALPTIKVIAPEVKVPQAKAPVVNVKLPTLSAPKSPAPVVKVTVPRAPSMAPVINITTPRPAAPTVNVAAAKVVVPKSPAPVVNVAAPKIALPKVSVPKITVPRVSVPATKAEAPAAKAVVPRSEPLQLPRSPQPSPAPVTLNFQPVYHFTLSGEASKDGKVDPRLIAYFERRDQQNKVEIMEMLRRNGFGRMTR